MGKFNFYLWFVLLCPLLMQAQKGQTKTIVDAKTKLALDYVAVQSDNNSIRLMSNKDGKFILISDNSIKAFTFYKMGFRQLSMDMATLLKTDSIFLVEKQIQLEEVVVKANKIDTLVKDKRFYVDDYCVLPNDNFLLINSKINVSGVEVCYFDKARGIRQVKKIKAEQDAHFVRDCFKNIHVVTANFSRQVFFNSDTSFEFLPKYRRQLFDSALAPCVLKIDTQVIMKQMFPPTRVNFDYTYATVNAPLFNYYRVSRHARELFYTVAYNEHMVEMMNHEIEDTRATARNEFVAENQIALFFSRIAAPLYAPVFLKNDTVVLFNFQENKIDFLSKLGTSLKSVKLNEEQFLSIHAFEIIYDGIAQKFYMKMNESNRSVLKQVNIYSGTADKIVKLEKVFAKNIQVVNNRIFYLVKEKEWDDTQYLYQQN
ncbi:MAG TPA: hypothetical protein PL029_00765 [Bacteroidia bacterium]|nr:hypothetical protein [Bacteroidia bacterium]